MSQTGMFQVLRINVKFRQFQTSELPLNRGEKQNSEDWRQLATNYELLHYLFMHCFTRSKINLEYQQNVEKILALA